MQLVGDFIVVCVDISVAIIISFTTAIMWTCAHLLPPDNDSDATNIKTPGTSSQSPQGRGTSNTKFSSLTNNGADAKKLWHIKPPDKIEDEPHREIVSPALMVIVGMGLVYAIYPGIATGANDSSGLRAKAGTLSTNANLLYSALINDAAAQTLANNLKKAASNPTSPKGLKELLTALSGAPDVVASAKGVLAKYNEVATEYGKVAADVEVQKKTSEFNQVKSAFTALQKASYEGTDDTGKNEATADNKRSKFRWIVVPSIIAQWLNLLTYVLFTPDDNIMEQVYNHTQDKPSYHADVLKAKANEIQSKADQLKATANSQSTSELATTKAADIQGDKKGSELKEKATQLANKSETLNQKANEIETAANPGTTLSTLSVQATQLKDAAKKESTSGSQDKTSLYYHAGQLATHSGVGLGAKADNVITKFEAVQGYYEALMDKASDEQKKNPLVKAVTTEYTDLEGIYNRILNLTKLAVKANELNSAATGSVPTLQTAAGNLETNVKTLRNNTDTDYDRGKTVIDKFNDVKDKFNALSETDKKKVQNQFEALKKVYDSILNFTKVKYYSEQLTSEATGAVNAEDVITNFNAVVTAYKALDPERQSQVKSDFKALQIEYSEAIYFYKWHLLTMPSS